MFPPALIAQQQSVRFERRGWTPIQRSHMAGSIEPGDYFHVPSDPRPVAYVVEAVGQGWIGYRWIELDGRDRRRKVTLEQFEELQAYCPLDYAASYRAAWLYRQRHR